MNRELSSNRHSSPWQTVAVASLTLAILSVVSPQVSVLGRGLRTTLPALVVSLIAISAVSPVAFIRAFTRFWPTFLFGSIFLIQAALRFANADQAAELWRAFFVGPLLALLFLLWIAALAELGDDAIHQFRRWVLFCWCLSLALGLPTLISNPKVARLTMGNPFARENAAIWGPRGIGEYHIYTSLAICIGPLYAVIQYLKGVRRLIPFLLLGLASASVLFSTFTMAATLLVLSVVSTLLVWTKSAKGLSRLLRTMVVLLLMGVLPLLYVEAKMFPQTKFVVTKVERLYKGITKEGLAKGDETSRGKMFSDDMRIFAEEPFLGFIPGVKGQIGHRHSSLADSLVLFGLFGAVLWGAALYKVFRVSLKNARDSFDRGVLWVGWFVLVLGGILNPIWHSSAALGALFALTLPARHKIDETHPVKGSPKSAP